MAITRQEWADWLHAPVTQAVIRKLEEQQAALVGALLNVEAETLEGMGLLHLAYRNQLDGLGAFLDLDHLCEMLVEEAAE